MLESFQSNKGKLEKPKREYTGVRPFQCKYFEVVLEFLTELFNSGLGYSSINTARGALSSMGLTLVVSIGRHPLVIRYMRYL